jgi:hypothetical protein
MAKYDVARELISDILSQRDVSLSVNSGSGIAVVYNPLAKAITNTTGRITVDGIGKINASLPNRYGEFEFHDPRAAAEFLEMPGRISRLEQNVDGIKHDIKEGLDLVKQQQQRRPHSEDKCGELVMESQADTYAVPSAAKKMHESLY